MGEEASATQDIKTEEGLQLEKQGKQIRVAQLKRKKYSDILTPPVESKLWCKEQLVQSLLVERKAVMAENAALSKENEYLKNPTLVDMNAEGHITRIMGEMQVPRALSPICYCDLEESNGKGMFNPEERDQQTTVGMGDIPEENKAGAEDTEVSESTADECKKVAGNMASRPVLVSDQL